MHLHAHVRFAVDIIGERTYPFNDRGGAAYKGGKKYTTQRGLLRLLQGFVVIYSNRGWFRG